MPITRLPAHPSLDGTSIHAVTRNSKISLDCHRLPAIWRVIDPHPMQDDGQPSCYRHDGFRHASALCDRQPPLLQRRRPLRDPQRSTRGLDEHPSNARIPAFGDPFVLVDLPRLIACWRQTKVGSHRSRSSEPGWLVDAGSEAQSHHRSHTWRGHEELADLVGLRHTAPSLYAIDGTVPAARDGPQSEDR